MSARAEPAMAAGLRAQLNRFSHVTVNVSDLERAREFWEATFPVRVTARTGGTRQAFPSLGVDEAEFRGYMLHDDDSEKYPSRGIHLVQWRSPSPVGTPYEGVSHVGWYRLAAVSDDVWRRYELVLAAGGRPYAEPRPVGKRKSGLDPSRSTFGFMDPDGITLEWVTSGPRIGGGGKDRAYHACANCRDLRTSFDFYTKVLGLDPILRTMPDAPRPAADGPALGSGWDGEVFLDGVFLAPRGDTRNPIDLVGWSSPEPKGKPYESPFNLGIVRLALEVDDIETAYVALLDAAGEDVVAGPPETWDYGDLGERQVVIFHDPDGLELELIQRAPTVWETDPARASYPPLT